MYLDAGRLDDLVSLVEQHAEANKDDAAAQLLHGLVLDKRGRGSEAVESFQAAERIAPDDYYPPLQIGLLQARLAEHADAVDALSRAIERGPPRIELPDIYHQLGRLQLRLGRNDAALTTFGRLADEFPKDKRVLTELAQLLAREGQLDAAVKRWEQVADLSRDDPYQLLKARLSIAEVKSKQGRLDRAIEILDEALNTVKPRRLGGALHSQSD